MKNKNEKSKQPIEEPIVEKEKSESLESSDIAAGVGIDLLDDLFRIQIKNQKIKNKIKNENNKD